MIQPGTTPRRRNRTLVVGVVLLLAGLVGGIAVSAKGVGGFVDALDVKELTVPARTTEQLAAGDYAVYQRVGTTSSDSGTTTGTPTPSLDSSLVTVTGPGGTPVTVDGRGSVSQNITVNNVVYVAFAFFTASTDGAYTVTVAGGEGADGAVVAVKPTLGSTFSGALPWIGVGLLSALLFVVGLVVTLVGAVRGRRPKATAPASAWPAAPATAATPSGSPAGPVSPAGTPAGWYPDPRQPGVSRWWDGSRWTDHTR